MRVLLVEPSRDMGGLIRESLGDIGVEVVWARQAQEGINLADKHDVDVVVLEPAIPAHNGLEFLHEFRSYDDWHDVPVIIFTHLDTDSLKTNQEMLSSFGVVECLYKPTTRLSQLHQAVKATVDAKTS